MKRILILMADYGYGHHSAANAIAEALKEIHGQDCVVEIVNPLDDERAPEPEEVIELLQPDDEIGERRKTRYVMGELGMSLRVVA